MIFFVVFLTTVIELMWRNQATRKTYDLLYALCSIEFPFSFRDDKNSSYAYPIVLWLHMCLVIFNFVLVIVFENPFVENISGLYLPLKKIFFAFSWHVGALAIHDPINPNSEFDIFCSA